MRDREIPADGRPGAVLRDSGSEEVVELVEDVDERASGGKVRSRRSSAVCAAAAAALASSAAASSASKAASCMWAWLVAALLWRP